MKNNVLRAAKELDFTSNEQYYDYCIETYHNGQFGQLRKLWGKLPKNHKHSLIAYIDNNYANDQLHNAFVTLF